MLNYNKFGPLSFSSVASHEKGYMEIFINSKLNKYYIKFLLVLTKLISFDKFISELPFEDKIRLDDNLYFDYFIIMELTHKISHTCADTFPSYPKQKLSKENIQDNKKELDRMFEELKTSMNFVQGEIDKIQANGKCYVKLDKDSIESRLHSAFEGEILEEFCEMLNEKVDLNNDFINSENFKVEKRKLEIYN